MGIYQLLAPIMALSYAFTSAGIQTAISKYTAAYHAQGRKRSALATLLTGFLLSILLSVIATVFYIRTLPCSLPAFCWSRAVSP